MGMMMQCAKCRECEGAAYQTPPPLFCGNIKAPIMVIAQNPGEIRSNDKFRLEIGARLLSVTQNDLPDEFLEAWYMSDYVTSQNYATVSKILSGDWLDSGRYLYTNAVRCRTPKNAMPSKEMIQACAVWTRKLYFAEPRLGAILLGDVATQQLLGADESKLKIGRARKHPKFGILLRLPHPSRWSDADVTAYKEAVKEFDDILRGVTK